MSNISELIASLLARSTTEGLMAEEYGANNRRVTKAEAATDTATAAIVDPWNAAVEAMKAVLDSAITNFKDGYWECNVCRGYREGGHAAWCPVPMLAPALARMEGTDDRD